MKNHNKTLRKIVTQLEISFSQLIFHWSTFIGGKYMEYKSIFSQRCMRHIHFIYHIWILKIHLIIKHIVQLDQTGFF